MRVNVTSGRSIVTVSSVASVNVIGRGLAPDLVDHAPLKRRPRRGEAEHHEPVPDASTLVHAARADRERHRSVNVAARSASRTTSSAAPMSDGAPVLRHTSKACFFTVDVSVRLAAASTD